MQFAVFALHCFVYFYFFFGVVNNKFEIKLYDKNRDADESIANINYECTQRFSRSLKRMFDIETICFDDLIRFMRLA